MEASVLLWHRWLTSADNYYYCHHREAAFPVLRARFALSGEPAYYADARSGQLVGHVDNDSKWNRWLFNALHQLDFAPAVRARPAWDLVVIALCTLGAMLAATGVVLAWRRLRMRGRERRLLS